MIKVLVLGNPDDLILSAYVNAVLAVEPMDIWVSATETEFSHRSRYEHKNVFIFQAAPRLGWLKRVSRLNNLLRYFYYYFYLFPLLRRQRFDIVHVHGMQDFAIFIARHLTTNTSQLICTYWGSDLHRHPIKSKAAEWCLRKAKYIVLSTLPMRDRFFEIFGQQYCEKMRIIKFGVTGFIHIDTLSQHSTPEECKLRLGIPTDKIAIAVGYNTYPAQQHLKALEAIARLPDHLRKKLFLVFQMTYGDKDPSYSRLIRQAAEQMDCAYRMFETYMGDEETACLRLAVDIFVHAQLTDAFCATIQEYLYAGATLINPAWIHYPDLHEHAIPYLEYATFDELTQVLEKLLTEGVRRDARHRTKLATMSSWPSVAKTWAKLYSGY